MGYAKEKKIVEAQAKRWKIITCFIALFLVIVFVTVACIVPVKSWKYLIDMPKIPKMNENELRLHFIDVGQGDATLIEFPDGRTMLIDAGNGSEGANKELISYLKALKIKYLDYIVVTHADVDHFGGFEEVFEHTEVSFAYLPKVEATYSDFYAVFHKAMTEERCEVAFSSRSIGLSTKDYTLQFLYPYTADENMGGENDSSAVIWLDYKGTSALFTGDLTADGEEKLRRDSIQGYLRPYNVELNSTEILKVSHHGSNSATKEIFLKYMGVKTAVISCGVGNLYGHPNVETLTTLNSAGVDVHRTDIHGSVIITMKADGTYETLNLGH